MESSNDQVILRKVPKNIRFPNEMAFQQQQQLPQMMTQANSRKGTSRLSVEAAQSSSQIKFPEFRHQQKVMIGQSSSLATSNKRLQEPQKLSSTTGGATVIPRLRVTAELKQAQQREEQRLGGSFYSPKRTERKQKKVTATFVSPINDAEDSRFENKTSQMQKEFELWTREKDPPNKPDSNDFSPEQQEDKQYSKMINSYSIEEQQVQKLRQNNITQDAEKLDQAADQPFDYIKSFKRLQDQLVPQLQSTKETLQDHQTKDAIYNQQYQSYYTYQEGDVDPQILLKSAKMKNQAIESFVSRTRLNQFVIKRTRQISKTNHKSSQEIKPQHQLSQEKSEANLRERILIQDENKKTIDVVQMNETLKANNNLLSLQSKEQDKLDLKQLLLQIKDVDNTLPSSYDSRENEQQQPISAAQEVSLTGKHRNDRQQDQEQGLEDETKSIESARRSVFVKSQKASHYNLLSKTSQRSFSNKKKAVLMEQLESNPQRLEPQSPKQNEKHDFDKLASIQTEKMNSLLNQQDQLLDASCDSVGQPFKQIHQCDQQQKSSQEMLGQNPKNHIVVKVKNHIDNSKQLIKMKDSSFEYQSSQLLHQMNNPSPYINNQVFKKQSGKTKSLIKMSNQLSRKRNFTQSPTREVNLPKMESYESRFKHIREKAQKEVKTSLQKVEQQRKLSNEEVMRYFNSLQNENGVKQQQSQWQMRLTNKNQAQGGAQHFQTLPNSFEQKDFDLSKINKISVDVRDDSQIYIKQQIELFPKLNQNMSEQVLHPDALQKYSSIETLNQGTVTPGEEFKKSFDYTESTQSKQLQNKQAIVFAEVQMQGDESPTGYREVYEVSPIKPRMSYRAEQYLHQEFQSGKSMKIASVQQHQQLRQQSGSTLEPYFNHKNDFSNDVMPHPMPLQRFLPVKSLKNNKMSPSQFKKRTYQAYETNSSMQASQQDVSQYFNTSSMFTKKAPNVPKYYQTRSHQMHIAKSQEQCNIQQPSYILQSTTTSLQAPAPSLTMKRYKICHTIADKKSLNSQMPISGLSAIPTIPNTHQLNARNRRQNNQAANFMVNGVQRKTHQYQFSNKNGNRRNNNSTEALVARNTLNMQARHISITDSSFRKNKWKAFGQHQKHNHQQKIPLVVNNGTNTTNEDIDAADLAYNRDKLKFVSAAHNSQNFTSVQSLRKSTDFKTTTSANYQQQQQLYTQDNRQRKVQRREIVAQVKMPHVQAIIREDDRSSIQEDPHDQRSNSQDKEDTNNIGLDDNCSGTRVKLTSRSNSMTQTIHSKKSSEVILSRKRQQQNNGSNSQHHLLLNQTTSKQFSVISKQHAAAMSISSNTSSLEQLIKNNKQPNLIQQREANLVATTTGVEGVDEVAPYVAVLAVSPSKLATINDFMLRKSVGVQEIDIGRQVVNSNSRSHFRQTSLPSSTHNRSKNLHYHGKSTHLSSIETNRLENTAEKQHIEKLNALSGSSSQDLSIIRKYGLQHRSSLYQQEDQNTMSINENQNRYTQQSQKLSKQSPRSLRQRRDSDELISNQNPSNIILQTSMIVTNNAPLQTQSQTFDAKDNSNNKNTKQKTNFTAEPGQTLSLSKRNMSVPLVIDDNKKQNVLYRGNDPAQRRVKKQNQLRHEKKAAAAAMMTQSPNLSRESKSKSAEPLSSQQNHGNVIMAQGVASNIITKKNQQSHEQQQQQHKRRGDSDLHNKDSDSFQQHQTTTTLQVTVSTQQKQQKQQFPTTNILQDVQQSQKSSIDYQQPQRQKNQQSGGIVVARRQLQKTPAGAAAAPTTMELNADMKSFLDL